MNHGNSYDCGVSKYWQSPNVTPNPPMQPSSMFPQHELMTNSPWQSTASGYSSVSPTGTVSSGSDSSPNSQCYDRSASVDLSVDSLISSLLQVVNSEDFGASSAELSLSSPGGYSDSLPNSESLFRPLSSSQQEMSSPPLARHSNCSPSSNSSRFSSPSPIYCEIHRNAQRYYCQTCNKPFCHDCGMHHHVGHVSIHLVEAIDGAAAQATQVLSEAKIGITAIREDIEAGNISAEALDQKARQASADVRLGMRRVAAALEAREKELLDKIEKARLCKYTALKARDDALRAGLNRLTRAADKLSDSMEMSSLAGNPLDLLVAKDVAAAEVFQVRQFRENLPQYEEFWISYTGPEGNALHAIASLGSIVITNPGHIGDRRSVRGRAHGGSSPQFGYGTHSPSGSNQFVPLLPVPRGRPIPSNNYPVVVRTGRGGQQHAGLIKPIKTIGDDGDNRDNLCRPWGVTCDKEGHIIVADRSNNRIQIYRQDGSFVRRFGTHGTAPGQFDRPAGVAVDQRRRIIVADKDNHRIQILTMEGIFLLSFGDKGSRCGQFNYPWDVAVNSECQIVVSDTRNHRVQLFSPEGIFLRKYGFETAPNMWKHFDSPRGVAFNPEGNVVVTDFNNHRVIIIDSDFVKARVLGCEQQGGTKQFLRPQGLVVDDEGNIIVADSRNHRIQIFDSAGTQKWKFGSHGKKSDEMDRPSGIALTPEGRIVVVDFGNNRVMLI